MFLQLKLASAKESLGWMRPSNGFHTKGSRRRHRKQRKQHSQSISLTSCWIPKCPLVNCWWYQYKASVFCAFWFLCPFPSMQVKFDMLSYHSCSIITSRVLFVTACSILRICVYIHTHHTQYIYISIYLSNYIYIYEPPSKSIVDAWYEDIGYQLSLLGGPIALQCFVQINTK